MSSAVTSSATLGSLEQGLANLASVMSAISLTGTIPDLEALKPCIDKIKDMLNVEGASLIFDPIFDDMKESLVCLALQQGHLNVFREALSSPHPNIIFNPAKRHPYCTRAIKTLEQILLVYQQSNSEKKPGYLSTLEYGLNECFKAYQDADKSQQAQFKSEVEIFIKHLIENHAPLKVLQMIYEQFPELLKTQYELKSWSATFSPLCLAISANDLEILNFLRQKARENPEVTSAFRQGIEPVTFSLIMNHEACFEALTCGDDRLIPDLNALGSFAEEQHSKLKDATEKANSLNAAFNLLSRFSHQTMSSMACSGETVASVYQTIKATTSALQGFTYPLLQKMIEDLEEKIAHTSAEINQLKIKVTSVLQENTAKQQQVKQIESNHQYELKKLAEEKALNLQVLAREEAELNKKILELTRALPKKSTHTPSALEKEIQAKEKQHAAEMRNLAQQTQRAAAEAEAIQSKITKVESALATEEHSAFVLRDAITLMQKKVQAAEAQLSQNSIH